MIDHGPAKFDENKLDQKPRAAKKKLARSAPAVQVYQLPDGRQVVVRRLTRNDTRHADGADFDPRDNFMNEPRSGRGVHVARPGLFETPF